MLHLLRTIGTHPDFQTLVALLDQDLALRDGTEHTFYAAFNSSTSLQHVVVAYEQDFPVGCGAFKEYASDLVEIKRMFVQASSRRKGVAAKILRELEVWAQELHYTGCVLETGKRQPEAISLYQQSGYRFVPNYGPYIGVENSVCLQKDLDISPATGREDR
ncbi:GNAT family N-acetyltransferase [Hymenobacter cellulosilyticus]|uniref:GNAT family N-acetyltransferase n=1 Tax=Hymenobacter cellulosilyticus TaxID=2932248 RepID=A0A8T9Q884_9BACT|nr:GNAT family N-acetyltransferase [Hymenobacter cellulosilyticus]UOQ71223.1 GNAT family N-acetyltransferase [Hymenobacter cellulosilyticus]